MINLLTAEKEVAAGRFSSHFFLGFTSSGWIVQWSQEKYIICTLHIENMALMELSSLTLQLHSTKAGKLNLSISNIKLQKLKKTERDGGEIS